MNTTVHDHGVISSDKVEGNKVYNRAGEKLGSIDDLLIDKRSGQVRYAVLEFGGFLGVGTDRYPLPWSVLNYDLDKGGYVVALDKAQLEGAPHFDVQDAPEFTSKYGQKVHDYYGVGRYPGL